MFSPEERQRVVELYFTTPMTTAQVVRHLGYPTRQCLERWLAKDPRYAGHMAKPIIPLETRTKAIELVLGGMQQKQAAERLGVSVGAVHNWVKAYREGGMAALQPRNRNASQTNKPAPRRSRNAGDGNDDAEVSDLLRRSDAARERFRQMFPLDGVEQSALEDYRKEWMARYVYNSNAIEGSTLTLEDTELVLEGEFVPTDSPARYIFAARGVADGMAYAERFAEEERTLSVEMIQKLHEVTALDMQPALRGRFRPYGFQARITATRVKTADPLEIYEDMEALVDAVNGSKDHPILKAAGFHAMFENIHPFTDGNGRTGRQILNLMLMAAGYRPVAIKHDAGRSYGKSLEAWQVDGDPKPFISQLVQCVDQEERAVAEIVGRLRENPFSENAIDGIGLEDGPARGRSL